MIRIAIIVNGRDAFSPFAFVPAKEFFSIVLERVVAYKVAMMLFSNDYKLSTI